MRPAANGPDRRPRWHTVNWRQANRIVRNLRQRIFRATQQGDYRQVRSLQKLMLRCHANALLSVRQVAQVNKGKHTPGIDKLVVKTPEARAKLVADLQAIHPWRVQPVRRVDIPKSNGKRRPLGMPSIRDRALQAVVRHALAPEWEAKFAGCSYGFRPGRGCHDAIARLFNLCRGGLPKQWIVDADIQGAFDHIAHRPLLCAIGFFPGRRLIAQWLKAGVVEGTIFHPTEEGSPQGGVMSPLLMNIALHGMENA